MTQSLSEVRFLSLADIGDQISGVRFSRPSGHALHGLRRCASHRRLWDPEGVVEGGGLSLMLVGATVVLLRCCGLGKGLWALGYQLARGHAPRFAWVSGETYGELLQEQSP